MEFPRNRTRASTFSRLRDPFRTTSSPADRFHGTYRSEGAYKSLWDGKKYTGCEVEFVTHDKLLSGRRVPDFEPLKGSEMYRKGWRANNSFVADGPGTGVFGVEKESVLCLVRHEQPAYLDDYGNIIQSETLRITVQCRYR
jgi:hypothetical protein